LRVEEYFSSYEKLLEQIERLLEEDNYPEIMGLISEIDHLIALIDEEVKKISPEQKRELQPRAMSIIKKQEAILSAIDEKVQSVQSNISMLPKLQKAAKTYGKNQ